MNTMWNYVQKEKLLQTWNKNIIIYIIIPTYYGVHLKTYKAEILYNLQQLNLFIDIFLWDNIHYRAVLQQWNLWFKLI